DAPPLEEATAVENGMPEAESNQLAGELDLTLRAARERPVDPRDLVVLTVGGVVALLAPADLVAAQQHRDALGGEDGRQEVAELRPREGGGGGIVGGALHAAIPGEVLRGPVPVLFPVRLVVLVVEAHEIQQREAVVRGDEVDAGRRAASIRLV